MKRWKDDWEFFFFFFMVAGITEQKKRLFLQSLSLLADTHRAECTVFLTLPIISSYHSFSHPTVSQPVVCNALCTQPKSFLRPSNVPLILPPFRPFLAAVLYMPSICLWRFATPPLPDRLCWVSQLRPDTSLPSPPPSTLVCAFRGVGWGEAGGRGEETPKWGVHVWTRPELSRPPESELLFDNLGFTWYPFVFSFCLLLFFFFLPFSFAPFPIFTPCCQSRHSLIADLFRTLILMADWIKNKKWIPDSDLNPMPFTMLTKLIQNRFRVPLC